MSSKLNAESCTIVSGLDEFGKHKIDSIDVAWLCPIDYKHEKESLRKQRYCAVRRFSKFEFAAFNGLFHVAFGGRDIDGSFGG